jgi:hypothetical protein
MQKQVSQHCTKFSSPTRLCEGTRNVKIVKEQTFHKRSDLTGMKPKRLSLFPNVPHRKSIFIFGPGEQILDQIETIFSQQDKFGNDTPHFSFVSKTITERFSLHF